jgi:methionyl-tRNA formyltransferase
MKIVFAGTPEFAAQAMRAIESAGHQIVLALTQPDRRAGRGMHLQASPVKTFALEKNIPVLQPATLRLQHADLEKRTTAQEAYQYLSHLDFDAMVVVAYGLILPQEILDLASQNGRHGCFNIHASLLPRWRGAAPIQRAIESGDVKTGVSIMQMDVGLDTGDTVLVQALDISPQETSATLHDRLADLGSDLVVSVLNALDQDHETKRMPQAQDGITYAEKILKSEAEIDWSLSAGEIDRRIRFLNKRLEFAVVVDNLARKSGDADAEQVFFGATVTYSPVEGTLAGKETTITIVGVDEVDLDKGHVSWVSPIAKALIKARLGDCVKIQTPNGPTEIEILDVQYL